MNTPTTLAERLNEVRSVLRYGRKDSARWLDSPEIAYRDLDAAAQWGAEELGRILRLLEPDFPFERMDAEIDMLERALASGPPPPER